MRQNRENTARQRDAIRNARARIMKLEQPALARQARRQRKLAQSQQYQGEQATQDGGDQCVGHQIVKPQPQRGAGIELGIAAANEIAGEHGKANEKSDQSRQQMPAECIQRQSQRQREKRKKRRERQRQGIWNGEARKIPYRGGGEQRREHDKNEHLSDHESPPRRTAAFGAA